MLNMIKIVMEIFGACRDGCYCGGASAGHDCLYCGVDGGKVMFGSRSAHGNDTYRHVV